MRNQRSFSLEFKRRVIEELLSGESRPAQLCRRYDISFSVLYHWKKQYCRGKFNNEPTEEVALKERIEQLERLVLKAITDAQAKSQKMANKRMKGLTGGLKIPGLF